MIKSISTALALALAAPMALAVAPMAAQAQSVSAEASTFSQLYMPADVAMDSALAGFDSEIGKSLSADPEFQAMEARYPGLGAVVSNAARGVLIETVQTQLPGVQTRLAALADSLFTPAELRDINAFMGSTEGRNAMLALASTADSSGFTEKLRASGKMEMTADDFLGMVDPSALTKLTKAEQEALIRFSISPAGRQMDAQTATLAQFIAAEMTALMQGMQQPIQQAVSTAIVAHIGAAEGK